MNRPLLTKEAKPFLAMLPPMHLKPFPIKFQVLVCADGAPSKLATHLGIVSRPPDSTCSRAYVEAGTHKFKADGVVFYNKELLPGMYNMPG